MTNLTHATIDHVANQLKALLNFQRKAEITKGNIAYLQSVFAGELDRLNSHKEPVGPLIDALKQGSVQVKGSSESYDSTTGGYPKWKMELEFPEFTMQFNWIEDPQPGYGNMDETVVMTSANDVTDKERENIEHLFAIHCDAICHAVTYNNSSLFDTPKKPDSDYEIDLDHAEKFFNHFGQQSNSKSDTPENGTSPQELVDVIKASAKLQGTENEDELACSIAAHMGIRENGLITSMIEYDRKGNPERIVSFWKLNGSKESLPTGQRNVKISKQSYDALTSN